MKRLLCRGIKSAIDDKHLFLLVAILNRRDHLRTRWTRQLGDKTPLALLGGEIEDADAVSKSMPDFFQKLKDLGADIAITETL